MKTIKFMYFWLNYCDKNNHLKRILIAVKHTDHLFRMASDLLEYDKLHLLLLLDGTQINNKFYLFLFILFNSLF